MTRQPDTPYAHRRRESLRLARKEGVRCLMVSRPEDVSYLTGFTGDDSVLLLGQPKAGQGRRGRHLADHWAVLVTDGRYNEQARSECPDVQVTVRQGPMSPVLVAELAARRQFPVGAQADHVTLLLAGRLEKELGKGRLKAVTGLPARLREIKDETEIRAIRLAIHAAEEAFLGLIARGAKGLVGRTEREVAAELEYRMRLCGADGPSFATIVAAGPHGSLPHYRPDQTRIQSNQPLLIDWGAKVAGYCSDLTRVVFPGRITPKWAEVYDVVLRAQAAGIRAIRPGASCRSVDLAARNVIRRAGYGEQFVHGLGHGIGREIHEGPVLGKTAPSRLRSGMVVTVEPGIYLPGAGGVRIEDDVVVTAGGWRRLSSLPKDIAFMNLH